MLNTTLKRNIAHETMVQPMIIGGTQVPEGKYPWFAVLLSEDCGASLIHPEILLTAGHCMRDFINAEVAIGVVDLDADAVVRRTVVKARRHPDYSHRRSDNDFAVLKLDSPVTEITPVELNTNQTLPADFSTVTIMGYGITTEWGREPPGLMEANVSVVNQDTCRALYRELVGRNPITDNMFCAGMLQDNGKDTCNGDSGAPVVDQDGVQVGVTSWGDGCSRLLSPGVYSRVSSAMDFIQDGICALADEYRPASCDPSVVEAMNQFH